jgi:hypothetical protein
MQSNSWMVTDIAHNNINLNPARMKDEAENGCCYS